MSREIMCQYGNCLEMVGPQGVSITLKTPDNYDASRGVYCCALHAGLALLRLAEDRKEPLDWVNLKSDLPRGWKSA